MSYTFSKHKLEEQLKKRDVDYIDFNLSFDELIEHYLQDNSTPWSNNDPEYFYHIFYKSVPIVICSSNLYDESGNMYSEESIMEIYNENRVNIYTNDSEFPRIDQHLFKEDDNGHTECILVITTDHSSYDKIYNESEEIYFASTDLEFDLNIKTPDTSISNCFVIDDARDHRTMVTSNGNDIRCSEGYDFEDDLIKNLVDKVDKIEEKNSNKNLFLI